MTAAWRTQRNTIDNIRNIIEMANIVCNVTNIYSIYYVELHRKVFDKFFNTGNLNFLFDKF